MPEESLEEQVKRLKHENEELRMQTLKRVKEEDGKGHALKKERVASASGGRKRGGGVTKKEGKIDVIIIGSDSDDA